MIEADKTFRDLMLNEEDIERFIADRDETEHVNVKPASAFIDGVIGHFSGNELEGDCMPWPKVSDLFRFRHSEVTVWNGINGHGKSLVLGQVVLGFIRSRRSCIASFEMKPITTLSRMTKQHLGSATPTPQYIREFLEGATGKLWLYDQQGTVKADKLLGVMYYAAEKLLVEHFVIDSLMKCGIGEDDYNGQKAFVDRLCAFAKDTECHVHLVTHAKKDRDEFEIPGKMSVKGSGSITDQVDNVLTVWRNKKKEQKMAAGDTSEDLKSAPDAMVICDKQRNSPDGWEGRIALWYDRESMRYRESSYRGI